jgi:type I restriction enzyme M protein
MITGELKSKIDRIWHVMWTGGYASPLTAIEQLTYLLFKRLDENPGFCACASSH